MLLCVFVVQRDWTSEFAKQQRASQISTEGAEIPPDRVQPVQNSAKQCKSFGVENFPILLMSGAAPHSPLQAFPPSSPEEEKGGGGGGEEEV